MTMNLLGHLRIATRMHKDLHFDYNHQQTISLKLSALAHQMLADNINAPAGESFGRRHYAFFGLLNKAFSTHNATRLLATKGFVDDGFSLVRTSAEIAINAAFINWVGGEEAAADYNEFNHYRNWKEYEGLKQLSNTFGSDIPAERLAQMKADYERVKDRYERNGRAATDWTNLSLARRALEVDKKIEQETGKSHVALRFLYERIWRDACHYAHSNAIVVAQAFGQEPDGTVLITRQATKEEAAFLIDTSNYVMFRLLALLDIQLGIKNVSEWKKLETEWLGKPDESTYP